MNRKPFPRISLGTMTFGWSQTSSYIDKSTALDMLNIFVEYNNSFRQQEKDVPSVPRHYIDAARIYAGGKTEKIVRKIISKFMDSQNSNVKFSSSLCLTKCISRSFLQLRSRRKHEAPHIFPSHAI